MSKQNVARFDRNGKSKHIKICHTVVHTCTEKGSAQDGLDKEKSSFWLLFRKKKSPLPTQTPYTQIVLVEIYSTQTCIRTRPGIFTLATLAGNIRAACTDSLSKGFN
jgi:hypothetical protein